MAENKASFVLYAEYIEIFEALSDSDAGALVKHMFRYVNDKDPVTDNQMVKVSFIQIKNQLKRDLKKWDEKIISKSNAGKMSAAKKLYGIYKNNLIDTIKDINIEFEINHCIEHKKECDTDSYMVYYYDLCIDFLLKQKPTKSTPVESVENDSTKSTVNVDVDVDVDEVVNENENVNEDGNDIKPNNIQPPPEKGEGPPSKINLKSLIEEKIKLKDITEELINSIESANDKKYIQTALGFWELFKKNMTDLGLPIKEMEKADILWADEIRKLHTIDGYQLIDFQDMYAFLQENEFWKDKILSVMAFRKRRTSKRGEPKNPMKIQNIMSQARSKLKTKEPTMQEAFTDNADFMKRIRSSKQTLGDLKA